MIDAAPQLPRVVMVQNATTHEPTFFLAFMAVGEEESMQRLQQAAERNGFSADRTTNDKDQTEVMVVFRAGSDTRKALTLYRDACAGRFGPLKVEVTIAPLSAAADGRIDVEKEVTVESPSAIVIPTL